MFARALRFETQRSLRARCCRAPAAHLQLPRADALPAHGAQGCTLLSCSAARRACLVDASGEPVGTFGRGAHIEVRGVVAGATERVPTLRITYEVAGKAMSVTAGITKAQLGCDLLVSRHDILKFTADGFTLTAKN